MVVHALDERGAGIRCLGGGCRAPIAALGIIENNKLELRGMISDNSGEKILCSSLNGSADTAEKVGQALAEKLLKMGADKFIGEVSSR